MATSPVLLDYFDRARLLSCAVLVATLAAGAALGACGGDSPTRSDADDSKSADDDESGDDENADDEGAPAKSGDAGSSTRRDGGSSTPRKDAGASDMQSRDAAATVTSPGADAGKADPGPTTVDPTAKQPAADKLPKVKGACPTLKDGMVTVLGSSVKLWVGSKPGPMVFYWHGTNSSADEVAQGLPGATAEVKSTGGIVASFDTTGSMGMSTGNNVWYTGDFDSADQILACGIEAGLVDTGRIYSSGYSAGGLQTGAMVFARSNYLASAVVYSGGPALGGLAGVPKFADPGNIPATVAAHGAKGSDAFGIDFSDGSHRLEDAVKAAGGLAIDCDDGGSHLELSRLGIKGKAWQFLKDHPYNTKPSPYAGGLPTGWPDYCQIVK